MVEIIQRDGQVNSKGNVKGEFQGELFSAKINSRASIHAIKQSSIQIIQANKCSINHRDKHSNLSTYGEF